MSDLVCHLNGRNCFLISQPALYGKLAVLEWTQHILNNQLTRRSPSLDTGSFGVTCWPVYGVVNFPKIMVAVWTPLP